jgi:methylmalonyl-CoA/ethylmalonyl-CoA epimerase
MHIKRIHHVTLAVRNIEDARLTFERLLGAPAGEPAALDALGVLGATVAIGDDALRLVSPLQGDSPVMRFLERRGEGFYNLALEVDDLDAAVRELADQGIRVSEPIESEPGIRSAFVAMAATHGLSIQLVEAAGAVVAGDSAWERPAAGEESAAQPTESSSYPTLDLTPDEWSDID